MRIETMKWLLKFDLKETRHNFKNPRESLKFEETIFLSQFYLLSFILIPSFIYFTNSKEQKLIRQSYHSPRTITSKRDNNGVHFSHTFHAPKTRITIYASMLALSIPSNLSTERNRSDPSNAVHYAHVRIAKFHGK